MCKCGKTKCVCKEMPDKKPCSGCGKPGCMCGAKKESDNKEKGRHRH